MPRLIAFVALCLPVVLGMGCLPGPPPEPTLVIDSPAHGTFTNAGSITVTGHTNQFQVKISTLTVNGQNALPLLPGKTFSTVVNLDPVAVVNPIVVEMVLTSGKLLRRRVTLVVGDGVDTGYVIDGDPSPQSVGLRVENTGLDQIEPIVETLSGDSLDIASLITDQNPIASGNFGGVIDYIANAVEVDFDSFSLDAGAVVGGIDTAITITDFFIELDMDLDWLGSCTLEVNTATTTIDGNFDLAPDGVDPSLVDVNLTSPVTVTLGGFTSQFVSGVCNDPLIGDIINLILGQNTIQDLMQDGFEDNLADPDGAGPLDSPLADGIEQALAGISIAGPVGIALGGNFDAPIASISEDVNGLTIAADATVTANSVAPGAPDLPASYTVAQAFPAFPPTTPVGGVPYGMAFGISTSALNQLLKTQIEAGLLQTDVTEFPVGQQTVPLTAGVLSLYIIELLQFDPAEPAVIHVRPTMAPVFTGNPGPSGELLQMLIGALEVEVRLPDIDQDVMTLEIDLDTGVDLAIVNDALSFSLGTLTAGQISLTILDNPLNSNEQFIQAVLSGLFPQLAPLLADGLGAFPIPSFLGLQLSPLEVSPVGDFAGLFADLAQVPTTTIQNVVITDQSTGDFQQSGGCWLREWRHRISGKGGATGITANLRGMLGADAGCTTNDAESLATAAYRVTFDVVTVPGEQWQLDLDHSINGAFELISDGYNDGIGFQDGDGTVHFQTPVQADWQYTAGATGSGSFDFTPSVTVLQDPNGIGGNSDDFYSPFDGAAGTTLNGTGDVSVQVDVSFDVRAKSNSNTAFPTANGDEMGMRFGKNDTIDNNFTAGQYPGTGNRNIADDGHFLAIDLTVTPAP